MNGSVVVLGDVMLDIRAVLAEDFAQAIDNYATAATEVTMTAAGTGVGMARALAALGAEVHLLAAVGSDIGTDLLADLLGREPFDLRVVRKAHEALGVVLILRDGHQGEAHGRRIVAAQSGANTALSIEDVIAARDLIASARLLCVDGYGLLAEPRRSATLGAMRTARDAGAAVFLDLVPHDLFRHWTDADAEALMADATVVASSGATLAHLVGHQWEGMRPVDRTGALTVAALAEGRFGARTYLVHFGIGHCTQTLAYRSGVLWWTETNYPNIPQEEIAGFGDRLNAHELARLLDGQPVASAPSSADARQ